MAEVNPRLAAIRNVAARQNARLERITQLFIDVDKAGDKTESDTIDIINDHHRVIDAIADELKQIEDLNSEMRAQLGNSPAAASAVSASPAVPLPASPALAAAPIAAPPASPPAPSPPAAVPAAAQLDLTATPGPTNHPSFRIEPPGTPG